MTSVSRSDIVVFVRDNNNYYRQGTRMTRKDYKLIAQAFKDEREYYRDTIQENTELECLAMKHLAERLALSLSYDNPLFNRDIFFKACGL